MTVFIYPGSFDPFTNGHYDIARRAAGLCDQLFIAVMVNSRKTYHLLPKSESRWPAVF